MKRSLLLLASLLLCIVLLVPNTLAAERVIPPLTFPFVLRPMSPVLTPADGWEHESFVNVHNTSLAFRRPYVTDIGTRRVLDPDAFPVIMQFDQEAFRMRLLPKIDMELQIINPGFYWFWRNLPADTDFAALALNDVDIIFSTRIAYGEALYFCILDDLNISFAYILRMTDGNGFVYETAFEWHTEFPYYTPVIALGSLRIRDVHNPAVFYTPCCHLDLFTNSRPDLRTSLMLEQAYSPEQLASQARQEAQAAAHFQFRLGELPEDQYREQMTELGVTREELDITIANVARLVQEEKTGTILSSGSKMINAPHVLQATGYFCAPASFLSTCRGVNPSYPRDQHFLARRIGIDSGGTGFGPLLATVATEETGRPYFLSWLGNTTLSTFKTMVVSSIDAGKPIIANGRGCLNEYDFSSGHYVVIRGYMNFGETLLVMEPAFGRITGVKAAFFAIDAGDMLNWLRTRGIVR